jgi:hypothetical protein
VAINPLPVRLDGVVFMWYAKRLLIFRFLCAKIKGKKGKGRKK